jgi:hypothetical protein
MSEQSGTPTPPPSDAHLPLEAEMDARTPFEVLLGDIDQVIAEWRELVRLEPWSRLPAARLVDSLPEILPRIVRLAQAGASEVDEELRSRITDEHGFFRREDAVPLLAVAEEWVYLKRACTAVLRRRGFTEAAMAGAIRRLEALIDDAIGYTPRGYYRPELDALRGRGLERRDSGVHDRRRGPDDRRGGPGRT